MSNVGEKERATQDRVVKLFSESLGYDYLGNWQYRENNRNVEETYLRPFLQKEGHAEAIIAKAIHELERVARDQTRSLYDINKDVYGLLRYGVKVKPEIGENTVTVRLIDWDDPQNNHFGVAEEVTVAGENDKRPDVVLYVNGIALGVLELKRSTVSVGEGIRQNLDNQKELFIRSFFTTLQFLMAGNDTEGLRYGTIETKAKYYLTWHEEDPDYVPGDPSDVKYLSASSCTAGDNPLDCSLSRLCEKRRFLQIIHDFIAYDKGTKKLCRHNQYFGILRAQERVRRREGGIIWHTQGSGKTLTMIWLAKWIRENITNSRVLIVTDRDELDDQIEKVFKGVNETIYRTTSGADLIDRLNKSEDWLICSLIHKFAGRDEGDVDGYVKDLERSLPSDFKAKGDIYVYVDECHRTQSGKLRKAMEAILPNAMFIGFTGTPLLQKDKKTSIEIFGPYIHTYKYDEAVLHGVVLDLRYEARSIDQYITSQGKIDQWFEAKTKGLNDIALAQLKQKWGTMQKVLSSKSRLEMIVNDIVFDMETKDRLQSGEGNAMLVSGSIYQACKYYELFLAHGFDRCAIVTSYKPSPSDIKGEETGDGLTEKLSEYEIYQKMLGGKTPEKFEKDAKQKFIDEPGQMKLLIVVDKLLTGFDAPSATYLYIDKSMQDHGLFQAICRVNRLDGESKEYGYIIDYKDLFKSLEDSMHTFTSGAFDGYDKEDVAGLLSNRLERAKEDLEDAREQIKALCEPVAPPRNTVDYIRYFCAADTADKEALKENEPKRVKLYQFAASLLRAYANVANEMPEAGYSTAEIEKIKGEVEHYEAVRQAVKLASGDYVDMKMYEPAMRHLIDTYIRAEETEKISAFDDMTLIKLIVERGADALDALPSGIRSSDTAMAETIENNLRRVIIDEQPINPKYYEKMSELLDALIEQRKEEAIKYQEYLAKIVELTKQIAKPGDSGSYPPTVDTRAKRALYDNFDANEKIALDIDLAIRSVKKDGWRGNKIKEREIYRAIRIALDDEAMATKAFELAKNQPEY